MKIHAKFCKTFKNAPMAMLNGVNGGPFCDTDMTPLQMEQLAATLIQIAKQARLHHAGKTWVAHSMEFDTDELGVNYGQK